MLGVVVHEGLVAVPYVDFPVAEGVRRFWGVFHARSF